MQTLFKYTESAHGSIKLYVCNSLIVAALSTYLQQLLNLGDPSGSTNENDVVNIGLVHLGISERLLHWLQSAAEKVGAKIFETSASDRSVVVDALEKRVDLDAGGKTEREEGEK